MDPRSGYVTRCGRKPRLSGAVKSDGDPPVICESCTPWWSDLLNESLPKLSPRYSELNIPTAIVTGDSDLIVPAKENAHRLQAALPNSHLTVLPHTGHQVPFTRPGAVVEAIDRVAGAGR